MPKVSIVIPVYNMEKLLDRCMESVLSQTMKDIEILLVDDGSSDGSPALCDRYATLDGRVRVIHKENGGLTSAWKRGSAEATGEYIGYVDSDDFIAEDMYERMYERAAATGADIVCCGLTHWYEGDPKRNWTEQMEFSTDSLRKNDLNAILYPTLINDGSFMGRHLQPNRVTKLVKSGLVQKNIELCRDEVSIGEDYQFSLCVFLDAERVEIIRDYFPYFYYMNDASMTGRHDKNYPDKIRIMRENLCRISDAKQIYDLKPQIWNDYVGLLVLHTKAVVYKQKTVPYSEIKKELKEVLSRADVREALGNYYMPSLSWAEKLYLFFMKHHMYFAIYTVVRLYFRK
nr:glycosyltransferase family 2 protein [Lachnospiraceae bacterium]